MTDKTDDKTVDDKPVDDKPVANDWVKHDADNPDETWIVYVDDDGRACRVPVSWYKANVEGR